MNKLKFCISLREKGLSKNEIVKELTKHGFEESELDYYLKKSDEIYLNQLLNNKPKVVKKKASRTFKSLILITCLVLLISVLMGYATIGLIGLFLFWSLIKFSSYR